MAFIDREFQQAALVEDFLPGRRVHGAGRSATATPGECLPASSACDAEHYGKHKVLRADLRGVGLTKIGNPGARGQPRPRRRIAAADAMNCLDHVRIDMKTDAAGTLRIMEVNGIPGLKPHKSWGPQLYTLHHRSPGGEIEDYRLLVKAVIDSGCRGSTCRRVSRRRTRMLKHARYVAGGPARSQVKRADWPIGQWAPIQRCAGLAAATDLHSTVR